MKELSESWWWNWLFSVLRKFNKIQIAKKMLIKKMKVARKVTGFWWKLKTQRDIFSPKTACLEGMEGHLSRILSSNEKKKIFFSRTNFLRSKKENFVPLQTHCQVWTRRNFSPTGVSGEWKFSFPLRPDSKVQGERKIPPFLLNRPFPGGNVPSRFQLITKNLANF